MVERKEKSFGLNFGATREKKLKRSNILQVNKKSSVNIEQETQLGNIVSITGYIKNCLKW